MGKSRVTRENLPQVVEFTLRLCESQLQDAQRDPGNYALTRDLQIAVDALQLINSEIHAKTRRSKDQRSCAFTRYVIDEEDRIVMDPALKETIVAIEEVYRRTDVI